MKKFLIASHGDFAKEMVNSVQMIMGPAVNINSISMHPHTSIENIKEELNSLIVQGGEENEYIILTDVLGGSISNLCTEFVSNKVNIITGFNLPMMLEMISLQEKMDTNELIDYCINQGKKGIIHVNKVVQNNS